MNQNFPLPPSHGSMRCMTGAGHLGSFVLTGGERDAADTHCTSCGVIDVVDLLLIVLCTLFAKDDLERGKLKAVVSRKDRQIPPRR
mmetsp:Transcript_25359/g.35398  ORF Transcript_25359/g.35398 Transcript_25359/m.35398 type:complete len:86 (-) Transcript_25359:76-333(-)